MTIARQYVLRAAPGGGPALETALRNLCETVRAAPGCDGVEILRDDSAPERFVFTERWTSMEAHKASAAFLPKDVFGPVMAAIADKPSAAYLHQILKT